MELDLRSINKCVRCGTCRSVCPVFEETGWESKNTRGRILVMKSLMNGCKPDADVLDSLNTCTTCGICIDSCPAGVNPVRLVEGARKELVSEGMMTDLQVLLNEYAIESGNIFGKSQDRLAWLKDKSLLKEKGNCVYFVGCLDSYRYLETAKKTFRILSRFGATLLQAEQCCGSPLLRTGFDASPLMEANIRQIEDIGADTIITGCAGCYTTLKNNYPRKFDVKSVPEFLAEHLSELNLRRLDLTVTYHDPCHLGRMNEVFDQPRQMIKEICNLKEMRAYGRNARCCGGGGGVRAGYKDLSLQMAKRRLEDVPKGVDYIVTCCPMCIRNLSDAGAGERVVDLVELVEKAMR
ncbi:MAG: (Fe-S)-binding protein [Methanotrichaceae archaeon]